MVSDQEIIRVVLEGMARIREGRASLDSAGADAFRELHALAQADKPQAAHALRESTGD